VPEHVVHPRPHRHVDGTQEVVERLLHRLDQLGVGGREARGRATRDAPVAEEQAERVGVHRHVLGCELHRVDERQLVTVGVPATLVPDHVVRLDGAPAATPLVVGGPHGPQVLAAGERRRAVLGGDPVDLTTSLGKHPQDVRRETG